MALTLPDWFICNAPRIREQSKLQAHQWRAQATDATFEAEITELFAIQAARVLAEARKSAGQTGVPSNQASLFIAYPSEVATTLDETGSYVVTMSDELTQRQEEQKELAIQAAEQFVIAKLWYSLPGDGMDERAKNYYINAQTLQGSLKSALQDVRRQVRLSQPFV